MAQIYNDWIRNHTDLDNIGSNTHTQIDSKIGYALQFAQAGVGSPADLTTYYVAIVGALLTTQGLSRTWIPFAGTIKAIYGHFYQAPGTNEPSTISILLNGATNITISNTLDHSATETVFNKTDLSQAVVAGDYLELKWVTPTWVTNPTAVRVMATVWVQT